MMSSVGIDYDGDGNTSEGHLRRARRPARQAGHRDPHVRHGARHADLLRGEQLPVLVRRRRRRRQPARRPRRSAANAFASWTARLLRATYNFQLASKDPGAFAHNAKYIIELLYDSITDLNSVLVAKVDMSKATRTDVGHFNGASEAARHWDQNEQVDATCSSCHGGEDGLPLLRPVRRRPGGRRRPPTASSAAPATTSPAPTSRRSSRSPSVTFPSGVVRNEPGYDNVCETCHRGREAKADRRRGDRGRQAGVQERALPAGRRGQAGLGGPRRLRVRRQDLRRPAVARRRHAVHVLPRSGRQPPHLRDHRRLERPPAAICHADANGDPKNIRLIHTLDYDGDGNTMPSRWPPRSTAWRRARWRRCRRSRRAPGSATRQATYPYFFKDTNGDKSCSAAEAVCVERLHGLDGRRSSKAAFNYQLSRNEPGRLGAQLRLHGPAALRQHGGFWAATSAS